MPDKKSREELEQELARLKKQVDALEHKPDAQKSVSFELPHVDFARLAAIDDHVKLKAPFIGILLILFLFACYLLAKSQVISSDFFDFSRASLNFSRFTSVNFLGFVFLASACYGLAAFFGFGGRKRHALFTFLATGIPAAIMLSMFDEIGLAFFAFAISISCASFFSAAEEKQGFKEAYNALGRALVVLTVLAFAFSFLTINATRDSYFDQFTNGTVVFAASATPGVIRLGAQVVESLPAENFQMISKDDIRAQLSQQAGFSLLSKAQQDALVDSSYNQMGPQLAAKTKELIVSKLNEAAAKPVTPPDAATMAGLKMQLSKVKEVQTFQSLFPLVIAVMMVSFVSILKIPFSILGAVAAWLLLKL